MMLLNKIFDFFKKQYHLKILKRRYYRHGKCKMCGCCCENIYVRHNNSIIKSKEEFIKIKKEDCYSFYQHITVVGKDDFGLIFSCDKFDKEKRICTQHKKRPSICSKYPTEDIFSMGASLKDDCGYSFEPIEKFDEIFKKVLKKFLKNFTIE